jgi:hypothetical protein
MSAEFLKDIVFMLITQKGDEHEGCNSAVELSVCKPLNLIPSTASKQNTPLTQADILCNFGCANLYSQHLGD